MNLSKKERKETLMLCIILIITYMPEIFSYYSIDNPGFNGILRICMVLSFSVFFYSSFKTINLPGRFAFVLIFLWMYVISIFNITPKMPLLTIFTISGLMLSGVVAKTLPLELIGRSFAAISIIICLVMVWQLSKMELNIGLILNRGYAWTEIFAYATLTSIWPICLFSAYQLKKWIWPAIAITLMCVLVNSLTLKRAIFVEVGIAIAIIFFVSWKLKDKRTFSTILKLGIPIFALAVYLILNGSIGDEVMQVSDAISNRFDSTSEDMSSFDRYLECLNYIKEEASFFDLLLGKGFFSAHHGLGVEKYFLHIGWSNFIFKGGLLFLILYIAYSIKAFKILRNPSIYSKETLFAAMFSVYSFFGFFFVNSMGFGPNLFFIFYCLMQVQRPVYIRICHERNSIN